MCSKRSFLCFLRSQCGKVYIFNKKKDEHTVYSSRIYIYILSPHKLDIFRTHINPYMASRKKKETKAERNRRLKALRRKHGLGEFKKGRNRSRSRTTSTRRRSSRKVAKKKRTYRRRSTMSGLSSPLMTGVVYAVGQPIASQLLQKVNVGVQDEILQIGAAFFAKKLIKNRLVNNWANAAIIVNTASLVSGYTGNLFGGGSGTSMSSASGATF